MSTGDAARSSSDRASQRRFVLRFFAIAAALLLLYCFPYKENGFSERWFDAFLADYARLARAFIALFDPTATVFNGEIHGRFAVKIVKGCDAMEAKILFVSAVLAFPAKWTRRLMVVALGLVTLTAVNVLRISSLYFIGTFRPTLVDPLHLEVWPFLMVAVASGLFLGGAALMQRAPAAEVER
jgi:exosortase/archaeosortase family protein